MRHTNNIVAKAVALAVIALLMGSLTACKTLPEKERKAAELAAKSSDYAKKCGTDKYMGAQRLLKEARQLVNDKKYDEARITFNTAEKLFKEAEAEAKKDPACNKDLEQEEDKAKITERDINTTDASASTGLDPLDDPDYEMDRITFPFNSSELTDEARDTLNLNARWLTKFTQFKVAVEGHCDNRGSIEYNLALGARRAESVKGYLIQLGISPDRIRTISYGEEQPLDEANDEEAWAKNRRAEFNKILRKK